MMGNEKYKPAKKLNLFCKNFFKEGKQTFW